MPRLSLAVVWVLAGSLAAQAPPPAPAPAGEWRADHGDNRSVRYSPLDQITRENVSGLRVAWEPDLGPIGPQPAFKNESAPLYIDGTRYLTAGIIHWCAPVTASTCGNRARIVSASSPMHPVTITRPFSAIASPIASRLSSLADSRNPQVLTTTTSAPA
jgi:hypothetical protein